MTVLSYGSHNHDAYEVTIDIGIRGLEDPTGYVYGETVTLTITGILQADDLASLLVKQATLSNAYKLQNQNVSWVSGSTTIYQILNDSTLYGVRVAQPPTFTQGAAPGELVNRRRYTIVLEAAYLYTTAAAGTEAAPYILDYESNLAFTGTGGPVFGHLPTITGKFQKQQLTETSLVTCQQSGRRVGLNFTPAPDSPLLYFADFEKVDRRVIRYGTPRRINNVSVEYPVFWDYTFERNQAFPVIT